MPSAGSTRAYLWLCGIIAGPDLVHVAFAGNRHGGRPPMATGAAPGKASVRSSAMRCSSRWALFGGAAIFLYVGAEVAIGTQMTAFLNDNAIWGLSDAPFGVPLLGATMGSDGIHGVSVEEAGKAVAFYWGGAMVGRAVGSALLAVSARRSCSRPSPRSPAPCAFTSPPSAASPPASSRCASACSTRSCSR